MKPKFTEEERKLIGRRIRDSRNAEKYTLEQLAEIIGCSPKHLGDVERGTVSASWPLAVKIGKALNTGVDYYLADTSDQYFDIQIDLEISNILKDCDMEGPDRLYRYGCADPCDRRLYHRRSMGTG